MKKSTIKANNYENAIKELEGFFEGSGKLLNEEIDESNANHVNVIMVKVIDQPGRPQNKVQLNIHCYDRRRFDRMKKNYINFGFEKMIVLHDPKSENKKVLPSYLKRQAQKEAQQEISEQIEKLAEKKYKEKLAKIDNDSNQTSIIDQIEEVEQKPIQVEKIDGSQIERLTVSELKQYAKDNGVDLTGLTKKDVIVDALNAWIEDQNN